MPKDQYQHFIPRFILRYFQDAQIQPQSKKEKQKNFWKARKTGVDSDTVLMYDLSSQTFEARPIGKVYGATNLYRGVQNPQNVDYLEEGFSRLENKTSIILRNLHSSLSSTTQTTHFQMRRKELVTLRKFIYLMNLRMETSSQFFYDQDHPGNAPIRSWIKRFMEETGLDTKREVWLHALRYYLDTPHHQIVLDGEAILKKYGTGSIEKISQRNLDLDIGSWHAVDYEILANDFFLGIWEAPVGEEFILTNLSFGLWEGIIGGAPGLHRLFVISPRVVLVLRSCYLDKIPLDIVQSNWLDIPMERARTQYAHFRPDLRGDPQRRSAALAEYRATDAAQEDIFTLKITKLTKEQTYLINHVLLINVGASSSITFSSTTAMTSTMRKFFSSIDPFVEGYRYLFRHLLGILSNINDTSTTTTPRSPFDNALRAIDSGAVEFSSTYSRAYRIYHIATDDASKYALTSSEIHSMVAFGVIKLKAIYGLPERMKKYDWEFVSVPLVKELPKEESDLFFALARHQIDKMVVGPQGEGTLNQLKYEAAVIGIVHWLADNRKQILHDWLYPSVDIFGT